MSRPLVFVVLLMGCASEGRLPASYFGEGARALEAGHVAVAGAAGAGATGDGTGVGGGARVRVGIGGGQEVGVEAAEVVLDSPSVHCAVLESDCAPGENKRYTTNSQSALVSWKMQLWPSPSRVPWLSLALVGGVGMVRHARVAGDPDPVGDYKGLSIDGSFGFIGSRRIHEVLDIYIGARIVEATPIHEDPMVESHAVIGVSSAVGGMLHVTKFVGLFGELGPRVTAILGDGLTFGGSAVAGLSLTM